MEFALKPWERVALRWVSRNPERVLRRRCGLIANRRNSFRVTKNLFFAFVYNALGVTIKKNHPASLMAAGWSKSNLKGLSQPALARLNFTTSADCGANSCQSRTEQNESGRLRDRLPSGGFAIDKVI